MGRRKNKRGRKKRKTKSRHFFELIPRNKSQEKYIDLIESNIITICEGPAGTGKTLISVAKALQLYQTCDYNRIIVVRPAVEALGESIGYLPGSASDKMRPFVAPVIDSLKVLIEDNGFINSIEEKGIIETIPFAFMRGRSLDNCIVIFDEAQNSTPAQMKLFLTRLGENVRVMIEGDSSQSDRRRKSNGLNDAMKKLSKCPNVGIMRMTRYDVVRSKLVKDILSCYESSN